MNALHVNWTAPFFKRRGKNEKYFIEDFELLTTMLSALKWREKNGTITLCADGAALGYYNSLGLLELYDGVEELVVDGGIDPEMFWAAGKLFALKKFGGPAALIDTDFIVWEEILFDKLGECTVIHFEELYPDVYPPAEFFKLKDGYEWQPFDWSLKACNTAFAVIKSPELIKYYTDTAIDFMKNAEDCGDALRYMVFAEQRLINMCAARLGIEVRAFSQLERLFEHGEGCFTHTWGMKQQMRDTKWLRRDFCLRCADRIKRDFPRFGETAEKITSEYVK